MTVPILDNPVDVDGLEDLWTESEHPECCDSEICDNEADVFVRVNRPCACAPSNFSLCQKDYETLRSFDTLVCTICRTPVTIVSVMSLK